MRSDDATEEEDWDIMDSLEVAKRSLGIIKDNAMDAINKFADVAKAKIAAAQAKCDALELKYNILKAKRDALAASCEIACIVIPIPLVGATTLPACVPCRTILNFAIITESFGKTAWLACNNVALNVLETFLNTNQLILWGFHYTLKLA